MHQPLTLVPHALPGVPRRLGEVATILRPRLLHQLDQSVQNGHRVTMVSGPAGYGKSVLVRQWVEQNARRWFIADFFLAGLSDGEVGQPDAVVVDESNPSRALLTDELLADLLERVPPTVNVVVARRSPPPDRIAGLFGNASIGSIDEADLAFTAAETKTLVGLLTNLEFPDAVVERVAEQTDGWPAGVLLAGLALREADGRPDDVASAESGPHRHVRAYLRDEILNRLSMEDHRFMLRTSLLGELQPDLCNAVTGSTDADARLLVLHRAGVITRAARPDRVVYSCHQLLRQCLRDDFRSGDPTEARAVATVAARWYREHGLPDLALEQYAQLEDWNGILAEVAQNGREMFARELGDQTFEYIRAVPAPVRGRDPLALFEFAVLQGAVGNGHAAEATIALLQPLDLTVGERALVDVIRASWVRNHARAEVAARAAQSALDVLTGPTRVEVPNVFGLTAAGELPALAQALRGTARWYLGDDAGALFDFEESAPRHASFAPFHVRSCGQLALLHAWAGRLRTAQEYVTTALIAVEASRMNGHRVTTELSLARARVARERNDLGAAESHLSAAYSVARRHRETVSMVICDLERAMLRLAQGRPKVGLRELEEARRAHSLTQETRFTRLVETIEARLRLRAGQRDQVLEILSRDRVRGTVDACPVAVELAVLDSDLDEALRWIEVWPDTTDLRPRLDKEIWTAVVDRLCGRRSVAVHRLGAILPEASAEGHVRAFLDGGAPIQSLLRDASQRHDGAFVRRLLSGDGAQPLSGKADSRELSRRELEILQFLPSRLTTAEIADRLFISRNTLKTHLRNIYAKLGVPSREEAIAQAGRRGLA